ncbi:GT2D2 protein, partial [Polyodon spathula]|nr:GT2D2 protein [Polyodon spathula]
MHLTTTVNNIFQQHNKGKEIRHLSDANWLCDLGFLCNLTEQLNNLNVKLQDCKQVRTEMYDSVKVLQLKLHFSLMKINKSAQRSRLNDKHLHSALKISSAQNMNPDIDKLVSTLTGRSHSTLTGRSHSTLTGRSHSALTGRCSTALASLFFMV